MELILFALPVLLLILMFTSQRKRQRSVEQLQASLQPGQEVVTTSGLYARVVETDGSVVVLEIAPGLRVRWDRRGIGSVVPDGTPGSASAGPATSAPALGEGPVPPSAGGSTAAPSNGPTATPPGEPGTTGRPSDQN